MKEGLEIRWHDWNRWTLILSDNPTRFHVSRNPTALKDRARTRGFAVAPAGSSASEDDGSEA